MKLTKQNSKMSSTSLKESVNNCRNQTNQWISTRVNMRRVTCWQNGLLKLTRNKRQSRKHCSRKTHRLKCSRINCKSLSKPMQKNAKEVWNKKYFWHKCKGKLSNWDWKIKSLSRIVTFKKKKLQIFPWQLSDCNKRNKRNISYLNSINNRATLKVFMKISAKLLMT